ncbi:MAG: DUF2207 domain-containing protein [Pseudomonadota bacterium]
MPARLAVFLALILTFATGAAAREQIEDYRIAIDVKTNGDIVVSETIAVAVEGRQIRRGIFRDLPRYYEKNGAQLPFRYDVTSVRRNGAREPYAIERDGNAFRIRIGDADVMLPTGRHVYEIVYSVENQIRYFDDYDELYWNAIGQNWAFPIKAARVRVVLPAGADVRGVEAYTGRYGEVGDAYQYYRDGREHFFTITRAFAPREGLTISLALEKGLIDPPSGADKRKEWWAMHGGLVALAAAAFALFGFYFSAFNRVGRDPVKAPIFPRYAPPDGYSPAAAHHIYYRRLAGHKALIASLINLAIKDQIRVDSVKKKKTTITRLEAAQAKAPPFPAEEKFLKRFLSEGSSKTFGGSPDTQFTKAYGVFQKFSRRKFGAPYFKWNSGYLIAGVALSGAAIFLAASNSPIWTSAHWLGVFTLIGLSAAFSYFLPAPTQKGQQIRTEIEGFRLYLEKAEKLQLNAAEVGTDAPPPMTVERYERFLPYAIALGVEAPWTKHFERVLPQEAQSYAPHWAHGIGRGHSLHAMNSALISSMNSGVSSALPQSSSSSGAGGGGFSGGGGGGGGGGGW